MRYFKSSPLEKNFPDPVTIKANLLVGCFGISLSRMKSKAELSAEQNSGLNRLSFESILRMKMRDSESDSACKVTP